jgi:hypothetical protein
MLLVPDGRAKASAQYAAEKKAARQAAGSQKSKKRKPKTAEKARPGLSTSTQLEL